MIITVFSEFCESSRELLKLRVVLETPNLCISQKDGVTCHGQWEELHPSEKIKKPHCLVNFEGHVVNM